jgi:hypothetical protein
LTSPGSPLERRPVFLASLAALIGLGLVAAFRSYAGPDTGFLLDEAARVLDGARLYVDLVDMNPPLIVLLNMAVVFLAGQLGLPEVLAYRLGCTLALLALLLLTARLLRQLMPGELAFRRGVTLLFAFALFTLAGQDFGEREHLVLALTVPYIVLAAGRAARREVPPLAAALSGLLAGVAFVLKPPFALLWLLLEAYLRLRRRVAWRALPPETVGIGGFLALCAVATVVWAPGYLELVRLLAAPYTNFLYVPFWELLVRGPGALLIVFALLAFVALRRHIRHPDALGVVGLGALACLMAGAAQQKGFSYHFYPALALAAVLLGLIAWDASESRGTWVVAIYRVIASSVFATLVVVVCVRAATDIVRRSHDPEYTQMERLLPLVRARAAGESVYVMSYNISSAYPLLNYAGAHSASRFAQLWILPAAYMDQLRGAAPLRFRTLRDMTPSERFLNQAVFEDLRDRRPKLLLVLQHARDLPENGFRRLDYIGYFARDPRIAGVLDRYQLLADLGDFKVYERVSDGAARSAPPPLVEPGTRDVARAPRRGGPTLGFGDGPVLLALLAFLVSVAVTGMIERGRGAAASRGVGVSRAA